MVVFLDDRKSFENKSVKTGDFGATSDVLTFGGVYVRDFENEDGTSSPVLSVEAL